MTERRQLFAATFFTLAMSACASPQAHAAACGNSAGGYEGWKQQFAGEARAKGISANTIVRACLVERFMFFSLFLPIT